MDDGGLVQLIMDMHDWFDPLLVDTKAKRHSWTGLVVFERTVLLSLENKVIIIRWIESEDVVWQCIGRAV